MEIGVDGVLVMGWRRRGKKKILKKKKKKKGEEREAEIEIKMVWRRGYSEEKEGCWWSACDGLTEKRKEKKKKKEDWEEREAEIDIRIVWRRRRRGSSEKKEGLGGGRWEIMKKVRKYYFNKKVCIIDKLMWVFCKNDSVK